MIKEKTMEFLENTKQWNCDAGRDNLIDNIIEKPHSFYWATNILMDLFSSRSTKILILLMQQLT